MYYILKKIKLTAMGLSAPSPSRRHFIPSLRWFRCYALRGRQSLSSRFARASPVQLKIKNEELKILDYVETRFIASHITQREG